MVSLKPALMLFALVAVSVVFLSLLYDITREPIRQQHIQREMAMISAILPDVVSTREEYIYNGPVSKIVTGLSAQNDIIGFVITASAPGYAGPVEIMAGFDPEGILTNVMIFSQRETPGLGTAILNPAFLGQFEGRAEVMSVVRMPRGDNEIAALASATISTEAVVNGVNAAIEYVAQRIAER